MWEIENERTKKSPQNRKGENSGTIINNTEICIVKKINTKY